MERWIRATVSLALAAALLAAWTGYRDALAHVGRTYPGFLVLPSGTIAPRTLPTDATLLSRHGLRPRDRVTAVDGVAVRTGRELAEAVRLRRAGEPIRYRVERPGGLRFEATIPAAAFPAAAVRQLVPLFLAGVLVVAAGALGVLARPELGPARVLFAMCWSGAVNFFVAGPDFVLERRFVPWTFLAGSALLKASLLHLALTFPQPRGPLRGRWRLPLVVALYALLGLQSAAYSLLLGRAPDWIARLDGATYATLVFGFVALAANVVETALRAADERLRRQARVALVGPTSCIAFFGALALAAWRKPELHLPLLFTTSLTTTFAASLTYALLRHNLFELDAVLRRGLSAGLVLAAGALLYLGAFAGLGRWLGAPAAWLSVALAVAALCAGVVAFRPLRERVDRLLATWIFPEAGAAQRAVAEVGPRLAQLHDAGAVAECLRELVSRGFQAGTVRVLRAASGAAVVDVLDPALPPVAPEVADACRAPDPVHLDGDGDLPAGVASELAALGLRVLVPFPGGEEAGAVVGALACGARRDGRLYTGEELEQLEAIAAQAAVAFANVAALDAVRRLQERLEQENALLRSEIELVHGFDEIVGRAPGVRRALAQVEQVAPTGVTVLVTGETGTGKELIVRALHALSPRSERPLVKVACAAIPESLVESELFGHERGAFTGAERARDGRFQAADGGTLFLDDVDALPLGVQAKLLRALQEGELQRLGSAEPRRVDVRVIAATNRDLLDEVRRARFREDLYYRLHVVPIELPPLRERREDVRALAEHFTLLESRKLGREPRPLSAAALAELESYAWPGNVRELRNVIERAVVLSPGGEIELPEPLRRTRDEAQPARVPLELQIRDLKLRAIRAALEASGGNQRVAAERLGLHRQSLTRMLRDLDLRGAA